MANELSIGGILASLRLDVKNVNKQVAEANKSLRDYQNQAERSNRNVAQSFAGMQQGVSSSISVLTRGLGLLGVALGGASLVGFAKDALRSATDLTNMSKALGTTTTELQELHYVFRQYQVTSGDVNKASQQFTTNLTEMRAGAGQFRQTLKDGAPALLANFEGVTDLVGGYEALADAIQRLKSPQDQLLLAQKALGQEMGARLLPALQRGGAAFAMLREEARKSGEVMDESSVKAADRFNRQFEKLIDTIGAKFKAAVVGAAEALQLLGQTADVRMADAEKRIANINRMLSERSLSPANLKMWTERLKAAQKDLADAQAEIWSEGTSSASAPRQGAQGDTGFSFEDPKVAAAREEMIQTQLDYLQQLVATGEEIDKSFRTPMQQAQAEIAELNILLQRGAIDADLFGKAAARSAYTMNAAYAEAASAVGRSLSAAFQDNKAVAAAGAIVDTYAAANKALAAPPGPPISYAYVAAALATGFANVRSILSTNKGSTSVSGGAAAGGGGGGGGAAALPGANQTLHVQGISPSQLYSGAAVDELISAILARQRDGVKVVLAGA